MERIMENANLKYSTMDLQKFPLSRLYTSKLVQFINTKKDKLEKSYYVKKIVKSPNVILLQVNRDLYLDIESGKYYRIGKPNDVFFDPHYNIKKLYVSYEDKSPFVLTCQDILQEKGISSNEFLSASELKEILSEQEVIDKYYDEIYSDNI